MAEIRQFITADSLGYLSIEGLRWFEQKDGEEFCDACFTGHYPTGDVTPAVLDAIEAERLAANPEPMGK